MKLFKSKQERKRDEFVDKVKGFGEDNSKAMCIMADPDTNTIVMTYKGLISAIHRKGWERNIKDMFLVNRSDDEAMAMNSPRNLAINQFLLELDGMVNNVGEKLLNDKENKQVFRNAIKGKVKMTFGKEKLKELKKV